MIMISGAKILTDGDYLADNGIIHSIDTFLITLLFYCSSISY